MKRGNNDANCQKEKERNLIKQINGKNNLSMSV